MSSLPAVAVALVTLSLLLYPTKSAGAIYTPEMVARHTQRVGKLPCVMPTESRDHPRYRTSCPSAGTMVRRFSR